MTQQQEATEIGAEVVERISSSTGEPSWLKSFRLNALQYYLDLPDEQSNLYSKYALDIKFDLSSASRHLPSEPSAASMHEIAEGVDSKGPYYITTRSETIASKNVKDLETKGVIFCDFHEALEKHTSILKRIFEKKAIRPESDKYAALNSALFSTAWLVYVPSGVQLEQPLRIRSYLNSKEPSFSQTWILGEPECSISLQTESYGAPIEGFASELVEAYVREGANVHYSNIQNYSENTTVLENKKAICQKDSTINWALGYFGGRVTRARLESVFQGDGASSEDVEVVFGDESQKFDLVSDLSHVARHTKGRILANSVLKDRSTSIFKGMIRIGHEAKNANAYLAGHSILLSPEAKSDAIPGLEILTNDVKATHSASVAQIDDDQIFYMMTRGLPLDEAKKFIVLGFLEPGISRIDSEDLRDTMRDLVEAKWYGKKGLVKKHRKEVLFEEEAQDQSKSRRDIFEGHYKYR